ncbi:hypothetical protein HDV05_006718 [Chytridiales sp. JEL 0842]|nr:hypothetical protein HDV05_006718 [Chytridiales sp. JEL 0842]
MTVSAMTERITEANAAIYTDLIRAITDDQNKVEQNVQVTLQTIETAAVDAEEYWSTILKNQEEPADNDDDMDDDDNGSGDDNGGSHRRKSSKSKGRSLGRDDGYNKAKHEQVIHDLVDQFKKMLDLRAKVAMQTEVVQWIGSNLRAGKQANGGPIPPMDDDFELFSEDFESVFETEVAKKFQAYSKLSEEEKYHSNELYPFNLPGSQNEDGELQIMDEQVSLYCPFTAKLYENPHTSKVCGHSFSDVVLQLIRKERSGRIECPMSGCRQFIRLSDLKPDKALARKVERHIRREQERDDGDEDAIVV